MAQLLVNADDFGLHPAINDAISNCVNFGSVNSISAVPNGTQPDFNLLRELKNKRVYIGAHITWVGEPWLTNSEIFPDWKALILKLIAGGHDFRKRMEEEARAQIDLLLQQGIHPSHIDSHQHVHLFPMIWNMTRRIQQQYNIENIRVPKVLHTYSLRRSIPGVVLNILASQKYDSRKHFYCAGIRYAGNYDLVMLRNELKHYVGKDTMLIVHPGTSNRQLNGKYSQWHFDWEKEYRSLQDIAFLNVVKENDFELKRPKDEKLAQI